MAMPGSAGRRASTVDLRAGSSTSANLRVVLPYVVVAGLWILLSDRLLAALLPDPADRMRWSIFKGLAFVAVTACLLAALLRRELRARARADAARREIEQRLSFALERSQTGGWSLDLGDRTVERTAGHDRIFGYDAPLERWSYETFLEHVLPEDRAEVDRRFRESLAARAVWTFECRIRRRDGAVRWIWGTGGLQEGDDAQPARLVGIVQDVTERHRAEAERQALDEQLKHAQRMESVGRLAGGIAHDFNNLLGVILAHAELLLRGAGAAERVRLQQIVEAAERAAALTRQLLAFSRRQIVEPKVLDLNVLLANLQRMLGRVIGEDVLLAIVPGRNLGHVKADPGQLEQVLMNLSVNARDAMPDGGRLSIETANVDVQAPAPGLAPGRYVRLVVADTGCGIASDVLPKVFEPFFSTKPLGKGTGLGLATVYGIVKQAGGHVSVASEPGRGSTFTVLLPLVEEPASAPEPSVTGEPARGSETVLLVEDEEALRAITRQVLAGHGYRVLEAGSAREALAVAAQAAEPIDLLLTDVVLPDVDGRQLARLLLASRPGLRVLYTTGYTEDSIAHRGVLEPGTQLLPKPYAVEALLRRVGEVVRGAAPSYSEEPASPARSSTISGSRVTKPSP